MSMRYDAVLFDLDGTLLDSLDDLAGAMNAVLAEREQPAHDRAAYKLFIGDGLPNLVRRALGADAAEEATVAACIDSFREAYGRRCMCRTKPYPGIPALLDHLTRRGVLLGVLSNKPHDMTTRMVAALLGRWRFETVVGARPQWPRKPDPTSALEVSRRLGVMPRRILYLGDSATDMKTAVAAGMFAVGAAWGFRSREELLAAGADALAETPASVLSLL